MRRVHRLTFNVTRAEARQLVRLGLDARPGLGFADVDDTDPRWPAVRRWVRRHGGLDIPRAEFSPAEVLEARWLSVGATSHSGYPQPEDTYEQVTYDAATYCPKCGRDRDQVAPFRMKCEPRWGRRGVIQLNWVYDELFVRPDVWRIVFRPLGIGCREVLIRGGRRLRTVVQLEIPPREVDVDVRGFRRTRCAACGRVKHDSGALMGRGVPPILREPRGHIARSTQYFSGGGTSTFRLLFVSQAVARALAEHGIRGLEFEPVPERGRRWRPSRRGRGAVPPAPRP